MNRRKLYLPQKLRDQILLAARTTFPLECCGLIEGSGADNSWLAHAIHGAKNIAEDPANRFVIDPQTHFDVLRSLRGSERRIIGCFHSHPNGRATPSEDDRAKAIENDFIWLIASGTSADSFQLNAFVFSEMGGDFIALDLCS